MTTAEARWQLVGDGRNSNDAADFDGDGHDDLLTYSRAGFGDDTLRIHFTPFPNTGFADLVGMQRGGSSPFVAVDDFDGNGHPDVAHIANGDLKIKNLISVYYGPFVPGTSVSPGSTYNYGDTAGFTSIHAEGYLTGDGYGNLIVYRHVNKLVGQPLLPGHFSDEYIYSENLLGVQSTAAPVRVGSFGSRPGDVLLLSAAVAGTETVLAAYPIPLVEGSAPLVSFNMDFDNHRPTLWVAGDVNGDGYSDIWLTSGRTPFRQHLVLGPFDEGAVIDASLLWDYRIASVTFDHQVSMGDADGDGVLDVLFGRPGEGAFLHLIKGLPD